MSDSPGTPPPPGRAGNGKRPSIGLQVKLPCATRDELKSRYGSELRHNAFFVRTRSPRPVETLVRLEAQLASGAPGFRAACVVVESNEAGMRLQLVGVDEAARALIAELGGTPPALLKSAPPAPAAAAAVAPPAAQPSPAAATPDPPPPPAATPAPPAPPSEPGPAPAAKADERQGPIIGIDLGTTNSAAAVMRHGKPFVIPSREGYNTIPSIVAINDKGNVIVGHPAKGQLLINPTNTVYGAKRLVGRQFESPVVRDLIDRFPYKIVAGERGEAAVQMRDRQLSLQEVSALVLTEVKEIAQQYLKAQVSRAVITVPAYYNDNQRQAVREAGELAGLKVERILNEPTAAALAFAHGRKLDSRVLVYDLGGGTFDASVLELRDNVYEVISIGGDTFLGGVDFDKAVVGHLLAKFKEQHGIEFPGDRVALQRVNDAAERAKIALSEQMEVQVKVPFVALVDGKPFDLDATLTRSELIKLTGHLVNRTLAVCAELLAARGLKPGDVEDVLLVGGQSRMPLVRERVRQLFGKEPSKAVHPDEAVALGAAVLAHSLQSATGEGVVLVDVLPMSIGVGLPGGRFKKIVERNTALPFRKAMSLLTTRDQQESLEIAVFQGENERAQENEYLGTLLVGGIEKAPRGSEEFEILFELSSEALLTVTAQSQKTGRTLTATFSTKDTPEEVRKRLADVAPDAPAPPAKVGWFKRLFGKDDRV
ncbi:MAG TPA: Hsp70 family protein [Myxococcales bacterium]|nr:Hsp70 family protein [Myxococcales bacterium]